MTTFWESPHFIFITLYSSNRSSLGTCNSKVLYICNLIWSNLDFSCSAVSNSELILRIILLLDSSVWSVYSSMGIWGLSWSVSDSCWIGSNARRCIGLLWSHCRFTSVTLLGLLSSQMTTISPVFTLVDVFFQILFRPMSPELEIYQLPSW